MSHQWLVIDFYFIEDDVKIYIKSLKINKSSTRINILKAIVIKNFLSFLIHLFLFPFHFCAYVCFYFFCHSFIIL